MIAEVLKFVKLNLPGSYNMYKEVFNKLLTITGDKSTKVFNINDIEYFKQYRLGSISNKFKTQKISPHTVNKEVRLIKSSFSKAYDLNLISENKIYKAKQIKINKTKHRRRFNQEEKSVIFRSISNEPTFKAATISRYTGMRLNEVICLQIKDIDLIKRKIIIRNKPGFNTKSGEERNIDIGNELWSYVEEWLKLPGDSNIYQLHNPEGYLISHENNKYSKGYISRKFKRTLTRNNIEGNFHCLRHTFASELVESGIDIETIRCILGHTNIETTSIYLQTGSDVKINAVNKII